MAHLRNSLPSVELTRDTDALRRILEAGVVRTLTKSAKPQLWRPWRAYGAVHLWTDLAHPGAIDAGTTRETRSPLEESA